MESPVGVRLRGSFLLVRFPPFIAFSPPNTSTGKRNIHHPKHTLKLRFLSFANFQKRKVCHMRLLVFFPPPHVFKN